ncbi:hypothetical protein IH980_05235, partial [Patescibacteria group bacterium]|nr:hypothetical protein [Patescibacteria group bacterium]
MDCEVSNVWLAFFRWIVSQIRRKKMTRIIFAVGMALLLSRVTIAEEATDEAKELLIKASKAADAGESVKAVELTSAAIKRNPSLANAYYLRGREHFRIGKVDESVVD